MLDILIPVHQKNLEVAKTCIESIDRNTPGVPYSIILAVDGTTKTDRAGLADFMKARTDPVAADPIVGERGQIAQFLGSDRAPQVSPRWRFVDWPGTVYYQRTVANGFTGGDGEFLAIVPPWIDFQDTNWFGKLQQPFTVDQHAMLVAVPPPGMSHRSCPPAKFMRRRHPDSEMLLTRRSVAKQILPAMQPVDGAQAWVNEYSRVAEGQGGSRWMAGSVRYFSIEHHDHACPQQESSETQEPSSESPSPTTPRSSSPTTTESDGIGVSAPF